MKKNIMIINEIRKILEAHNTRIKKNDSWETLIAEEQLFELFNSPLEYYENQRLLRAIFIPKKDKSPNLGARRQILKYKDGTRGRIARWHKKEQKYLDKYGNEYKKEELY